jgi:hypothetical protein
VEDFAGVYKWSIDGGKISCAEVDGEVAEGPATPARASAADQREEAAAPDTTDALKRKREGETTEEDTQSKRATKA